VTPGDLTQRGTFAVRMASATLCQYTNVSLPGAYKVAFARAVSSAASGPSFAMRLPAMTWRLSADAPERRNAAAPRFDLPGGVERSSAGKGGGSARGGGGSGTKGTGTRSGGVGHSAADGGWDATDAVGAFDVAGVVRDGSSLGALLGLFPPRQTSALKTMATKRMPSAAAARMPHCNARRRRRFSARPLHSTRNCSSRGSARVSSPSGRIGSRPSDWSRED